MSSENRAASALGRNYPGGRHAFVEAMNARARLLGMYDTHYVDSNGLSAVLAKDKAGRSRLFLGGQPDESTGLSFFDAQGRVTMKLPAGP